MNSFFKLGVILSLLFVSGCVPFWRGWMRGDNPTAATYSTLQPHEAWCYSTMAKVDCYPGPQRVPPESLVNVDPPSRYPLTRAAYAKALADYEAAAK